MSHAPAAHELELTPWAPPMPPKSTGPHRYVFVLLDGVDNEEIEAPRGGWKVDEWAVERGMKAVGASWFVVSG